MSFYSHTLQLYEDVARIRQALGTEMVSALDGLDAEIVKYKSEPSTDSTIFGVGELKIRFKKTPLLTVKIVMTTEADDDDDDTDDKEDD